MVRGRSIMVFVFYFTLIVVMVLASAGGIIAAPSWSQIPGATTTHEVYSVIYDDVGNILYAGTDQGVWRCTRPYTSPAWTKISSTGDNGNTAGLGLVYDSARDILYATVYAGSGSPTNGLWRCPNPQASSTWTQVGTAGAQKLFDITFDVSSNIAYMVAGGSGNVWQAVNPDTGSPTWNSNGGSGTCIFYEPVNDSLYVGSYGLGIQRLDNPGSTFTAPTWVFVTPPPTLNTYDCHSMAYDSVNNTLYAGFQTSTSTDIGVWRCTSPTSNPGSGWSKISAAANVGDDLIEALEYDSDSDILYAGTNSTKGVWRCGNPGSVPSWQQTGGVISNERVIALLLSNVRNVLFAGTRGSGVYYYTEPATSTWYLAEGTTAWGFSTYISIENPNPYVVTSDITYMTSSGPVPGPNVTLQPESQATVAPSDTVGQTDFSTKVESAEGRIAVDRTMEWTGEGAASPEAHNSVGVQAPDNEWYLPEGSSNWGFETWLLIQNPNAVDINCDVTYMIEGEGPQTFTKNIPASSRQSFSMSEDIGSKDASIKVTSTDNFIPERAMYRNNRREGHDSIGTTVTSNNYYLAEGTTAWGFTTYVLVQNPQNTENTVTLTYMTNSGPIAQAPFIMAANSRKTIRVNDQISNQDLSTLVTGTQPLIAERAMYWDNGTGEACHDSIGLDQSHKVFYLPDGQTSGGRETWTLVQNPNPTDVTIEVTYMTPDGNGNQSFTDTVPANSRKTYDMSAHMADTRAAIEVRCTTPGMLINVERAMYWNSRGVGTDTIGGYSD